MALPWYFWVFLLPIYSLICIFLILVILLQAGKGGGLSSLVGGGGALGDALGATGAEKTLSRWTTYCAIAFAVLAIVITLVGAMYAQPKSIVEGLTEQQPTEFPTSQPASGPTSEVLSGSLGAPSSAPVGTPEPAVAPIAVEPMNTAAPEATPAVAATPSGGASASAPGR